MRKIALDSRALAALPALGATLQSSDWRGLVRYAGSRDAEPVVWVQSILRHACSGPADPQTFLHADTFHPTVKAWLFLTDVAEDAGPFYLRSRLAPADRSAARVGAADEPLCPPFAECRRPARILPHRFRRARLPRPAASRGRLRCPANTLIVADTFGFHARGPSERPSLRVEIWAYGRRSPFPSVAALIPWWPPTERGWGRRSVHGPWNSATPSKPWGLRRTVGGLRSRRIGLRSAIGVRPSPYRD